jgi:hypothetical protein
MARRGLQISVRSLLALVACVAVNIWCFKVSAILGIVGLNVTKHVVIAQLCQALGVNRRVPASPEEDGRSGSLTVAVPTPPTAPDVTPA